MTESGFAANSGACHLCRGPGSAPPPAASGDAAANCTACALLRIASKCTELCLELKGGRRAVFSPAFVTYRGVQKSEATLKISFNVKVNKVFEFFFGKLY